MIGIPGIVPFRYALRQAQRPENFRVLIPFCYSRIVGNPTDFDEIFEFMGILIIYNEYLR